MPVRRRGGHHRSLRHPATAFVAEFVGLSNRLPGRMVGDLVEVLGTWLPLVAGSSVHSGAVTALVRPESVEVSADPAGPDQRWPAALSARDDPAGGVRAGGSASRPLAGGGA